LSAIFPNSHKSQCIPPNFAIKYRKNGTVDCFLTSPFDGYTYSEHFLKISSLHQILAYHAGTTSEKNGRNKMALMKEISEYGRTQWGVIFRTRNEVKWAVEAAGRQLCRQTPWPPQPLPPPLPPPPRCAVKHVGAAVPS